MEFDADEYDRFDQTNLEQSAGRQGNNSRGSLSMAQNQGKSMLLSEFTLEDKEFIIDVARPDPHKHPPGDMDYKDPNSEMILKDLLIVAHDGESSDMRKIMMTIDEEKFIDAGHSIFKLEAGIFQAYKNVYKNINKAIIMLASNR